MFEHLRKTVGPLTYDAQAQAKCATGCAFDQPHGLQTTPIAQRHGWRQMSCATLIALSSKINAAMALRPNVWSIGVVNRRDRSSYSKRFGRLWIARAFDRWQPWPFSIMSWGVGCQIVAGRVPSRTLTTGTARSCDPGTAAGE
jgi:hypothetical protein